MRQRHHQSGFRMISVLGLICACGGGRASPSVEPDGTEPCAVAVPAGSVPDTVTIAVTHELSGQHAPLPSNSSERLVFRQSYETLVTVDCNGQVRPALAESWTDDDGGRIWTFVIRPEARFWDGTRVTARHVQSSWLSHRTTTIGVSIRAVLTVSDRSVVVTFDTPQPLVPTMFADPAFAVVKENPTGGWPDGTGHYQTPQEPLGPDNAQPSSVLLLPNAAYDGDARPVLRFVRVGQRDVRDILDRDVDVVVTHDPGVIEYADGSERFQTLQLPWDQTYLMVSPIAGNDTLMTRELVDARDDLARRAVSAEARSASDWFGATAGRSCELVSPDSNSQRRRSGRDVLDYRVVYQEGDHVARSLAERTIVKLDPIVRQREGRRLTAVPLAAPQLADALEHGHEFAYIVAVARRPVAPCRQLQALMTRVPWLRQDSGAPDAVTVPLIDTRPRLIVREGIAQVTAEWDGALVFYRSTKRGLRAGGQGE